MTGVTEGDLDLVQRHAHGLGCRLRDDRVGAGADVGHVGLDNHPALAVKRTRAADFIVGAPR